MRLAGTPISPYRLYLAIECGMSFLLGITYATIMVYWVTSGRLNPLQLLLLGTSLEVSYFVFQLPTGVLADLVSRRLCVISGLGIIGLSLVLQGLSPSFGNLMAGQALLGLGAALQNGAEEAWIADELGEDQMTSVYLRATQLGLIATVGGSLLSGVIALAGLNVPLLLGGGLICMLAAALPFVMPEHNFRPAGLGRERIGSVARQAAGLLSTQTRSARRAIVAIPGLVLIFAMTLFVGLWSESFDRLWGAFLLRDIRFPKVDGLHPAMWFSLLAGIVALLALGATEVAKRRTQRLGADSVVGALVVLTVGIGAAVVIMARAHVFVIAVAAYLAVEVLRPVIDPLVTGWMVGRLEPSVRATALSGKEMFDSAGQIISGPIIGSIGTLASIRAGLLAGSAALAPAVACLTIASRRIRPRVARDTSAADGSATDTVSGDLAASSIELADGAVGDAALGDTA